MVNAAATSCSPFLAAIHDAASFPARPAPIFFKPRCSLAGGFARRQSRGASLPCHPRQPSTSSTASAPARRTAMPEKEENATPCPPARPSHRRQRAEDGAHPCHAPVHPARHWQKARSPGMCLVGEVWGEGRERREGGECWAMGTGLSPHQPEWKRPICLCQLPWSQLSQARRGHQPAKSCLPPTVPHTRTGDYGEACPGGAWQSAPSVQRATPSKVLPSHHVAQCLYIECKRQVELRWHWQAACRGGACCPGPRPACSAQFCLPAAGRAAPRLPFFLHGSSPALPMLF